MTWHERITTLIILGIFVAGWLAGRLVRPLGRTGQGEAQGAADRTDGKGTGNVVMAKFAVTGQEWIDNLARSLGQEPTLVRRIILDLEYGSVGKAYVELFADDKKLSVAFVSPGLSVEEIA